VLNVAASCGLLTRTYIGAGQVILFHRKGNRGRNREVAALVLVKNTRKHGGRIEVRNTVALDYDSLARCQGHFGWTYWSHRG
jgi:hypothetical protein